MRFTFSGDLICDLGDADEVSGVNAMIQVPDSGTIPVGFDGPTVFTESGETSSMFLSGGEAYIPSGCSQVTLIVAGNYTSSEKSGSVQTLVQTVSVTVSP